MLRRQHVVGLDIGTTKVCAVVGEADEDGEVHIAGVGSTPSSGMRKGVVIDIDATTRAIEDAVERTERMAGMTISVLYVGVSGEHITSTNSRGVIAVSRGDHEISSADVDRVIEAARMAALPAADREIVHMLPRGFVVDGHDGVRNPIGMYGSRLEVDAHIVTGTSTVLANLLKCVQRAGLELEELVLEPLASAEAVLTQAERELGVVLADIGGGPPAWESSPAAACVTRPSCPWEVITSPATSPWGCGRRWRRRKSSRSATARHRWPTCTRAS